MTSAKLSFFALPMGERIDFFQWAKNIMRADGETLTEIECNSSVSDDEDEWCEMLRVAIEDSEQPRPPAQLTVWLLTEHGEPQFVEVSQDDSVGQVARMACGISDRAEVIVSCGGLPIGGTFKV